MNNHIQHWHELYNKGTPPRVIAEHLGISRTKMYRKIDWAKSRGYIGQGLYGDPFNSRRTGRLHHALRTLPHDVKRAIQLDCPTDMTLAEFVTDIVRMHYEQRRT